VTWYRYNIENRPTASSNCGEGSSERPCGEWANVDAAMRKRNDEKPLQVRALAGSLTKSGLPNDEVNPIGEFVATKKAVPTETGVYRVIDVIGTSPTSWEDAAKNAVETAGGSLRDLRIAEVARLDVKIEGEKVVAYRARLQLSFKYEPEG